MNGKIPHPIPYQGSKRQIAPYILAYLPQKIERLVEPFAGSAAISLAVSYHGRAKRIWMNDAQSALVALWREIIHHPDPLIKEYGRLWNEQIGQERIYYDEVRDRFNASHEPADFLYLLARCVKACIRYNSNGEFNNTPDNRRKGARPEGMRLRVIGASGLLKKITKLSSWDFKKVLERCKPADFIYMDPPYQGVSGTRDHRYGPSVDHNEFCDQLAMLTKRKLKFAVSYDGRTGSKTYGEALPRSLMLERIEINAGRSSQATLLGRRDITYESLYLSSALIKELDRKGRQQLIVA